MMDKNVKGKKSKRFAKSPRSFLTAAEAGLICTQIRSNSSVIDRLIETIDLLVNKERCPKDANTLGFLRQRLAVAIAENDTFRRVLWCHQQLAEHQSACCETLDAASFLVHQIKSRRSALAAQMAMK